MSGVKVAGLENLTARSQAWLRAVEHAAKGVVAHMATDAVEEMASKSPQYSGDFAANWQVAYGAPAVSHRQWPGSKAHIWEHGLAEWEKPYQQGSAPAIDYAKGKAGVVMRSYRMNGAFGATVYITNDATHENEPYAWAINAGQIKFRPENFSYGDPHHLIQQGAEYVRNRYGKISKTQLMSMAKT